jgi:hypothetical protein
MAARVSSPEASSISATSEPSAGQLMVRRPPADAVAHAPLM